MKVRTDATARNKIESILLEEIEAMQLSLARDSLSSSSSSDSLGVEHFEKLFALIKRSQSQVINYICYVISPRSASF